MAGLSGTREAFLVANSHNKLKQTVKQAKNKFYNKQITNAAIDKNLFRLTKWANSTGQYKSPAFTLPDSTTASSNKDKRDLFQSTHLPTNQSILNIATF